jgi:MFS family permease
VSAASGAAPRGGLGALPREAWTALLGCFACQMGLGVAYVLGPLLKHVVAEFEWSRTVYAAGNAPLLLAMALGNSLIGDLTERVGARRVLVAATLLLGASVWSFSQVSSLSGFYATCALFGIALAGLGDIPVGSLASRWTARGRGLALGLVYVGSNAGGAVVPIALEALAARGSWRSALAWIGATAVAAILPFALFAVREPAQSAGGSAPDEPEARGTARAAAATPLEHARDVDLAGALRTGTFWVLAAVLFAFYLYYVSVTVHLVPMLTDLGWSNAQAAASFGGAVAVGIAGKLGIGALADRIRVRPALIANFALLAFASLLLLAVRVPGVLPVFLVVHGFTTAAENVLLPLAVAQRFGLAHMPRIYGALMLTLFAGGALGPILAAAAFDRYGEYRIAFTAFAALNILGVGLLARGRT